VGNNDFHMGGVFMRYPLKFLQRAGLVSMLLIVGVLVGLMAPPPSESSNPSITISVNAGTNGSTNNQTVNFDAVTGNAVINGVACTTTDINNGFNICYKIRTFEENGAVFGPAARQVKLMNAVGTDGVTQDARLLISDCSGSCQDGMRLTGLKIVPTVTTWDASKVIVKVTYHNKFDYAPNDTTLGTSSNSHRVQLSITGVFKDTAVPTTCTLAATLGCPVQDEMHMYGTGIFCTSTDTVNDCPAGSTGSKSLDVAGGGGNSANVDRTTCTVSDSPLCRMYFKVGNTATGDARLDRSQAGVDFPGFRCNNGLSSTPTYNPFTNTSGSVTGKKCVADVTHNVVFTVYGPDTINLDGSPRGIAGNCGTPKAPPCDCSGNQKGNNQCLDTIMESQTDQAVTAEKKVEVGIPDAIFCDPVTKCNGTINNRISVTPNTSTILSFPFNGIGPEVDDFTVSTATNIADPFKNVFTGPGGTDRTLAPDYQNPDWPVPQDKNTPFYAVDQINVTDAIGNVVGPPFVEILSCPNGNKGPVIIHDVEGTYNILYHIHTSQQPGALCQ
jgi:hypothetical protein